MTKVDREEIIKNWKNRGFTAGIWKDPPGQEWKDYVHTADELLMLLEGQLELKMKGKTLLPACGEEILIPAHTRHSVKNTGKTRNIWLFGYRRVALSKT